MNETWGGLMPVLFEIGGFKVESYPLFVSLAIVTGLYLYLRGVKRDQVKNMNALYIVIFALIGGTIGAKLPLLFIYWSDYTDKNVDLMTILSGRTIIGGLIGGFIGARLVKYVLGIKVKMGNQIAIPVAVAMAIGRVGCLLRGCCYGIPTHTDYGIDFGDHIHRHPTQLYELTFDVLLVIYLVYRKKQGGVEPGGLFRLFLNGYLGFRFFNEFIRVEEIGLLGLTHFQWLCVISLMFINREKKSLMD